MPVYAQQHADGVPDIYLILGVEDVLGMRTSAVAAEPADEWIGSGFMTGMR